MHLHMPGGMHQLMRGGCTPEGGEGVLGGVVLRIGITTRTRCHTSARRNPPAHCSHVSCSLISRSAPLLSSMSVNIAVMMTTMMLSTMCIHIPSAVPSSIISTILSIALSRCSLVCAPSWSISRLMVLCCCVVLCPVPLPSCPCTSAGDMLRWLLRGVGLWVCHRFVESFGQHNILYGAVLALQHTDMIINNM